MNRQNNFRTSTGASPHRPSAIPRLFGAALAAALVILAGCAGSGPGGPGGSGAAGSDLPAQSRPAAMNEIPVPDGTWRPHLLARCERDAEVPTEVERLLGISSEYFRHGSGSDGMIELELALEDGFRHSLLLLTLGQLYLLAGQGDPALLPVEGPAADVGDWPRNRQRLLGRAGDLLRECQLQRPDDAAVDYLLADVERAAERFEAALDLARSAESKCTGGRSFRVMKQYQALNDYPSKYLGGPSPEYPERALNAGLTGDVVLDLLLNPRAEVVQVVVVESPSGDLTRAAEASLSHSTFEAARIGKYPIWSWLRVKTAFHLEAAQ